MVEIVFTNYKTKETAYYKSKWTGMDNQNGLVSVGMDKNANWKVLSTIPFRLKDRMRKFRSVQPKRTGIDNYEDKKKLTREWPIGKPYLSFALFLRT